jgi:hypothetical protein
MTDPQNQDGSLATLVREHVSRAEPPFLLSPDTAIALGRRTLLRRQVRRGFAGVLVAAAAVAAVPLLPVGGSGDHADRPTSAAQKRYDAEQMPVLLEDHVRSALGDGLADLGPAQFTAFDDQGTTLAPRHYDQATGMTLEFRGSTDRVVEVTLLNAHTQSEADVHQICAEALASHVDLSCAVTTTASGDDVATSIEALRPSDTGGGWEILSPAELRSGVASDNSPDGQGPIDRSMVRFVRAVETVRNGRLLTTASETVVAPDRRSAEKLWKVPVADLEKVVTDPALVIPKPPLGPNGCPWMLHPEGITCGKS